MKFWNAGGNEKQAWNLVFFVYWYFIACHLLLFNCSLLQHECFALAVLHFCYKKSKPAENIIIHVYIGKNNTTYLILKLSAFRSSSSCNSLSVLLFLSSNFWILLKKDSKRTLEHWWSWRNNKQQLSNFYTTTRVPHTISKMKLWTAATTCKSW